MTTSQPMFSVYVIELGSSAHHDRAFDHPLRDPAKPCLYVGSTAKTVPERYTEQDLGAWTQSRACKKHGAVRLRMDLAGNKYAYSRDKAVEIEARLARELRRRGYGVDQH